MRTKIIVAVVAVAVVGSTYLWAREAFAGFELGCYTTRASIVPELSPDQFVEADCAQPHDYEAIAVVVMENAEERCLREAEQFLGGSWEESRTAVAVLTGGSQLDERALCVLAETSGTEGKPLGSTRSLKDGMRGDRRLAITCLVGHEDEYVFGDCAEGHAAEFVGVLVPPGGDVEGACGEAAARYVGVPELRADLGVAWLSRVRELCLVTEAPDPAGRHDTLRASVKGLGTGPLPV
ncbi:septum formation family protein [Dactylosporangium sp. NPDC005572]|uniref:septum formation family protein n=1 Tax=Dactylosporangium sp. NPDC005572 TaxID=3156889 RepID=UPI0033B9F5D1